MEAEKKDNEKGAKKDPAVVLEKRWADAAVRYKNHIMLERRMSANTVESYLHDVEQFAAFIRAEHRVAPRWATRPMVEEFMASLYDLGVGKTTQARVLSGVKSFYNFLLLEGVVDSSPAEFVEGPKIGRRLPDVLTVGEIDQILATFDPATELGMRNAAMIETMYSCGLRVSELVGLRLGDLYFDEGFIRVVGKGDRQRLVPISDAARERILAWLSIRPAGAAAPASKGPAAAKVAANAKGSTTKKSPGTSKNSGTQGSPKSSGSQAVADEVFLNRRGRALSRVMVFLVLKDAAATAGIAKTVSPHTLRHSFATHLLEGGASIRQVQELLGHESIMTTEIYTHLDAAHLRQTVEMYHPLSVDKKMDVKS